MTPALTLRGVDVWLGDCRESMRAMPAGLAQCCVTSPPYFGLRDYGVEGQLGLEASPAEYVAGMVGVFREVARVLRDDGTLWLNIGDSYASKPSGRTSGDTMRASTLGGGKSTGRRSHEDTALVDRAAFAPEKSLLGIPWRLAFALQDDGWILRAEIIWAKASPMPESVRDRPTRSHEQVFLFSRRPRYFYDAEAVRETASVTGIWPRVGPTSQDARRAVRRGGPTAPMEVNPAGRNLRTVWTLGPEPFAGSHFATFPSEIPRRAIRAGCPVDGTVLDPFGGSGTVGAVAISEGRRAVLCELQPRYLRLIRRRLEQAQGYTPPLPMPRPERRSEPEQLDLTGTEAAR